MEKYSACRLKRGLHVYYFLFLLFTESIVLNLTLTTRTHIRPRNGILMLFACLEYLSPLCQEIWHSYQVSENLPLLRLQCSTAILSQGRITNSPNDLRRFGRNYRTTHNYRNKHYSNSCTVFLLSSTILMALSHLVTGMFYVACAIWH